MAFNLRKLFAHVKLLTMGQGTTVKSTVPSRGPNRNILLEDFSLNAKEFSDCFRIFLH